MTNTNQPLESSDMRELEQYRKLGTLEEVREACNKQKARMCNLSGDGFFDDQLVYDTYECPNCGKEYELEYEEYDYCPNCGQHLLIRLNKG